MKPQYRGAYTPYGISGQIEVFIGRLWKGLSESYGKLSKCLLEGHRNEQQFERQKLTYEQKR